MSRLSIIYAVLITLAELCPAATLLVPSQYPTIQAGINAAIDGDTVLVADGTYTGAGNKNIDFLGKAIVVISENGAEMCIIDCENDGRGFGFGSGEDATSVLAGFTITNGLATDGGGISCQYSSPTILDCIISGNVSSGQNGGGIYCYESSPVLHYCTISDNTVLGSLDGYGYGGGIHIWWNSHPILMDCIISGNSVQSSWLTAGGGIFCTYSSSLIISASTISGNSAADYGSGGGLCGSGGSNMLISNCTIQGNMAGVGGGILAGSASNTTLVNSIVEANNYGGVHFSTYFGGVSFRYSNFHDNEGGNFVGWNVPPELGRIVTVNANGDSCDIFYNIFEDPLFEDPTSGNFQITWANFPIPDSTRSPCIDAGDPASPHDPDGTVADLGALYFDQQVSVAISLVPFSIPILIPANGGRFEYYIFATNSDSVALDVDLWTDVMLPDSSIISPLLGPVSLTLDPGTTGWYRIQNVPGHAPSVTYSYRGKIGDYPGVVWSEDSFPFTKLTTGADGPFVSNWLNTGDPPGSEIPVIPTEFALCGAYPNPFNARTVISYQLPVASPVSLRIYDTAGRLVTELVNGRREAGTHQITFDGSGLPSGLHFFRLTAGDFTSTGKMVLLK